MTADDALTALRAQVDAGAIQLGVNIRLMNSPGSPAFRRHESAIPIIAGLAASFAVTSLLGWPGGAVVITAFAVLWFGWLYPRVRGHVFDRTVALAFRSSGDFAALWRRGALSLHAQDAHCLSPRGDWISFVTARV